MGSLLFREEPEVQDLANIARIVSNTGFFTSDELDIAVSLVRERLDKGEASLYYFVFGEMGSHVIGYTCYGPILGTVDGFDLYWIAVDPEFQGIGAGRSLLAFTERKVVAKHGLRLYAETSSSFLYAPTRSFYENNGFLLEGRLADYYAPDDDKMLYVKHLDTKLHHNPLHPNT